MAPGATNSPNEPRREQTLLVEGPETCVSKWRLILLLWLEGRSLREVTTLAGVDRKTVRRYVQAAEARRVWLRREVRVS